MAMISVAVTFNEEMWWPVLSTAALRCSANALEVQSR